MICEGVPVEGVFLNHLCHVNVNLGEYIHEEHRGDDLKENIYRCNIFDFLELVWDIQPDFKHSTFYTVVEILLRETLNFVTQLVKLIMSQKEEIIFHL